MACIYVPLVEGSNTDSYFYPTQNVTKQVTERQQRFRNVQSWNEKNISC